jgi:energy-coupling factor transporter ATP-binding protein EcfA2
MITRIEAYRYRCFEHLNVQAGSYQVLVGRNGSGKSTLLDLPALIGDLLASSTLETAFFGRPRPESLEPRAAGAKDLIFNGAGNWFALAIEIELSAGIQDALRGNLAMRRHLPDVWLRDVSRPFTVRYELSFRRLDDALELSHEYLFLMRDIGEIAKSRPDALFGEWAMSQAKLILPLLARSSSEYVNLYPENTSADEALTFELSPNAVAMSGLPLDPLRFGTAHWLKNRLAMQSLAYRPDVRELRKAQPSPGRTFRVKQNGSTLAWSVLRLSEDRQIFEDWLAHVQSALPFISGIEARRREDDGHAYLRVLGADDTPIPLSGLSDGTLLFLVLTILPYVERPPHFLTVEEPENGLHPKAIEAALESLQAIDRCQVWVTSHSPIVVAVTPLEKLLCMSLERGGGAQVVAGPKHPFLAHWHGKPDLSTLHSAGVL